MWNKTLRSALGAMMLWTLCSLAQEGVPLSVDTNLPRAILGHDYHFQLKASGGIAPYHWELASGTIPDGITLANDGLLSGTATAKGEFHFVVTVSDSARPAHQKNQEIGLRVVEALTAEWTTPPQVSAGRIQGGLQVENGTEDDLDLTVIVLAVNEIGKAFALAYQHGKLKSDAKLGVTFDESLPSGSYTINADVVAEEPSRNRIYRTRLVGAGPLKVP